MVAEEAVGGEEVLVEDRVEAADSADLAVVRAAAAVLPEAGEMFRQEFTYKRL